MHEDEEERHPNYCIPHPLHAHQSQTRMRMRISNELECQLASIPRAALDRQHALRFVQLVTAYPKTGAFRHARNEVAVDV